MPYLTPDSVPEERDCRALLIPASSDWLAIFSGALTELAKSYNWQQQGITVDAALEVVNEVINGYYDGCANSGCTLPGGMGILRLNPETGMIEQLVNGEWVTPIGDYELPPTPPRTEPTAEERRCLAAANVVNALEIMYEELTDAFSEGESTLEALGTLVGVVIGLLAAVFGSVLLALAAIVAILFETIYETIEFVGADLWTADFTDKLRCFFYECASDDGDVIHFDYQCVINKIGAATEIDWSFNELRLLLQVGYLLNMLGSQTLDAAGALTAVDTADCGDCSPGWCFVVDLTDNDGGVEFLSGAGSWTSGVGLVATDVVISVPRTLLSCKFDLGAPAQIQTIDTRYNYDKVTANGATEGTGLWEGEFANPLISYQQDVAPEGVDLSLNGVPTNTFTQEFSYFIQPAFNANGGSGVITLIQVTGTGEPPAWFEDNGWTPCP